MGSLSPPLPSSQVQHIVDCRQISVGMGHLIKYLRYLVSHLPPDINESEAKSLLLEKLQNFLRERIVFSGDNIGE
jgi:translation initiation factor eIF-2B subunit delta